MKDYLQKEANTPFDMQSVLQILRAVCAGLGMVAIILGLVYASRMFTVIFTALRSPEAVQAHLDKWAVALGEEQLDLLIGGTLYHGARMAAIVILGGGMVLLAWISMGLILVGAKTASWILSDREAVKRLLVHVFGSARKPEVEKAARGNGP